MQSALILEDQPESRHWLEGIVSEALPGIADDAVDSLTQARCLLPPGR
jgi:DNA-binding LytR/AlgR family response regulator